MESQKCDVCKKTESVINLRHRNYCRSCASRFILQKFKKQMGLLPAFFETEKRETKGRLERLLVVADSSASSEAMLKMLEAYYVKQDELDKFVESRLPQIVVLDVSMSEESKVPEWNSGWMGYSKALIEASGTGSIGLSLRSGRIYSTERTSETLSLDDMLTSFPSDSRDQALSVLQSKIISRYSQDGNYEVILYPETATRIASKVLALTSQGKGFTVPWECGSFVKMPSGIYSVRPLKDLSDTEVKAYLDILHDLPLSPPTLATSEFTVPNSIDEIMTNYITNLESAFPSIVATTGRTADKLELPDIIHETATCLTCGMPRRKDNVKDWLDNITVMQPAPAEDFAERGGQGEEAEDGRDVTGAVCYGCYTLFRGLRKDIRAWPI